MEVRKGYKNTEIGIYPQDWEISTLADISVIERGKFTARPRNDPKYYGGDIPFIQTGDVTNSNGIIKSFSQTLNENGLKVSKLFPKGTLFFTIAANIGDVGFCNFDTACPDSVVAISVSDQINKQWLYYELQKRKKSFENIATHNTQLNLNLEKLRPYLIPVPSLTEQRAIAAALIDVDSLLSALDALIAKKRLIRQGAMQELLTGKKRLPRFTDKWKVKKIGEITRTTAGGTPSTLIDSYWGGEIKWMSSGELHLKRVYDVEGRITEEGLKNSSTSIIPPKCVLIGLAGQGKTRGTVAMNMVELCTNQSIAAILPSNAFIPEYLYFNFDSRYDELRSISTGDGGRGGLNLTLINKMDVPLPSLPEQTAIAEILSDMDAEIAALEARREKTSLLKQGMMQELLTGKTRLV